MPTNSYDLIVLGDDLPGLACGALCARRGLRTLVLAADDRPARYALGNLKLPTAPGILPGRGLGAAARIVRELGLDHALKRRVRDVRVTAQVVGPDARLDLSAEAQAQAKELVRELPDGTEAALTAWDQAAEVAKLGDALLCGEDAFPGVGFFERRDAVKQAARATEAAAAWWQGVTGSGSALLAALTALPAAAGGRAIDPPPLAIARALELWRQGAPALRGDGTGLRELLVEKLTAAGGELRTGAATELVSGWTKLVAVKLATGEELGAGQVVSALPVGELVPLFKKPPRRVVELAESTRLAGWSYAVNLVVDAAAVPEGMAPVVLAVGDVDAPLVGANAIQIHAGEPDDQGRAILTVTAVLPAPDGAGPRPDLAAVRALREAVLERLEDVVPFAHSHLIVMHSPYDDLAPVVPGGRGGYDPPRGGAARLPEVWRAGLDGGSGLAGAPYATGVKNLTLASTQVLPNLGLDGELAVAWNAARVACGIAGKKRDYLRDEVVSA